MATYTFQANGLPVACSNTDLSSGFHAVRLWKKSVPDYSINHGASLARKFSDRTCCRCRTTSGGPCCCLAAVVGMSDERPRGSEGPLPDHGVSNESDEPDGGFRPPQFVVRGGVATAAQLRAGTRHSINGYGFSVQTAPGLPVNELARGARFPNRQISVTTVEALRELGMTINAPTPGAGDNHGTVVVPYPPLPELFEALSRCFAQHPNSPTLA